MMRLTLRTLLAYLDDVLEPNEAREIGQKLNQSKEAAALVTQIREAIRRRRIGAPELAGPGSGPDPNVVSEYLENVLSPNQVVELEKLCRNSELHLAEVAACHKILTMVMGQPIDVSEELRERMYELGATKAAETSPEEPLPKPAPQMTSGMGTADGSAFGEGLPDYLKQRRSAGRIWSTLLVVLIAGVWVALIVSDGSIWNQNEASKIALNDVGQQHDDGTPADESIAIAEEKKPLKATSIPAKGKQEIAAETPQVTKTKKSRKAGVSINPPPPTDADVVASSIPKPQVGTPFAGNPPKMKAPESEEAKPVQVAAITKTNTPKMKKPAPEPALAAKSSLVVIPPSELNVILPEGTEKWMTTQGGDVQLGDTFAVPEPFQGQLNFQDDLLIQLLSGARLQRLPVADGVDLRIRIDRGRILLKRPPTSIHPRVVEIQVGKHVWQVKFSETGSGLALGVVLPQPEGRIIGDNPLPPQGGMAVIQGALSPMLTRGEPVELERGSGWMRWSPQTGKLLIDKPAPIPTWTDPDNISITPARSQLVKAYEREFQPDVLHSIAPIISDRRAIIADFAVKTMALTDNYLEVIPALKSDHEEARLAAIVVLREWIAADPQRMNLVRDEMERFFRPEIVGQIVTLLWGYSRLDAQSTETSQLLVQLLANDDLAIRELAHFHVTRLSGRNHGYHSQAPLAERNAAISRWVEIVKRDKSLVQPE